MKLKLFIIILFAGLTTSLFAQTNVALHTSIKTCNAKTLSAYFTNNVELTILDEDDLYSKTQAEMILKKFFNEKECNSFEVIHSGDAKGESKYVIGKLKTKTGPYRIYYVTKNSKILEFSIEEE